MRLLQPRADGPLSTLRRYFGHQTMWYFTENTVLFVDPRTASLNGPARTGRRLRRRVASTHGPIWSAFGRSRPGGARESVR